MRVRPQLSTRRAAITLLAAGLVTLTACGTRLPNSDFNLSQSGQVPGVQTSTGPSNGPTGPAGSASGGSQGQAAKQGTQGHAVTKAGQGKNSNGVSTGNLFAGACGAAASSGNKASDSGVTPTQITLGNVSSRTNPFGSHQFDPNYYGLVSFIQHCNAVGGINGRALTLVPCDDGGTNSGNVNCVNTMLSQHAFSMVANNIFTYGGGQIAYQHNLPDVGGEPITGQPYYTYPNFFNIYGDHYPKDGKNPGYQNQYWGTSELGAYFKQVQHVSKVGVVYYTQSSSQRGYQAIAQTMTQQGIAVHGHAVNLADPNYQAAVSAMKNEGDQMVFDALDLAGNQQLCQAMNSYGYAGSNNPQHLPLAKVSTIAAWSDDVGKDFSSPCRDIVWSNGKSASFDDTSVPMVKTFREDFQRYGQGQALSQWAEEGYIAGIWFAQAAHSCGSNLTRNCIEHYLSSQASMTADGLMAPDVGFGKKALSTSQTERDCVEVVRWNQAKGQWDTLAAIARNCYVTHYFHYPVGG
jgi:branched-chain amino acid transport system substrate-binding protein